MEQVSGLGGRLRRIECPEPGAKEENEAMEILSRLQANFSATPPSIKGAW